MRRRYLVNCEAHPPKRRVRFFCGLPDSAISVFISATRQSGVPGMCHHITTHRLDRSCTTGAYLPLRRYDSEDSPTLIRIRALLAQTLTSGDLAGTVIDPSGAGVPNANVTAKQHNTGAEQSTTTNAQGAYHFAFLPPGPYDVTAKASGFATQTHLTDIQVGQATTLNLTLALATASTTVEVSESYAAVQSQNANITSNISPQQLTNLPNSGNDMTYFALTAPGSVISTSGGYGNFSTYGLPATANLFTLNGQNDNDIFLNIGNSGASNLMLGSNELSEATVVNNGYTGQYGQLAGAQVNYVTKSGTNDFQVQSGSVTEGNADTYMARGRAYRATAISVLAGIRPKSHSTGRSEFPPDTRHESHRI